MRWMTYPMPRRSFSGCSRVTSRPSSQIRPEVGSMSRLMSRSVVDFPPPEGPTSMTSSPRRTLSVTSSTATVPSGYRLPRPSSRIISSAVGSAR